MLSRGKSINNSQAHFPFSEREWVSERERWWVGEILSNLRIQNEIQINGFEWDEIERKIEIHASCQFLQQIRFLWRRAWYMRNECRGMPRLPLLLLLLFFFFILFTNSHKNIFFKCRIYFTFDCSFFSSTCCALLKLLMFKLEMILFQGYKFSHICNQKAQHRQTSEGLKLN